MRGIFRSSVHQLSRRNLLLASGALALGCKSEERSVPTERAVDLIVPAMQTRDGAGVRLRRSLGSGALGMLDPFLLLDEIHSSDPRDYLAGFPTHPHRGFETVTYMLNGAMVHRDSMGNHGRLGPGSAQWMTAGHGIVHSEMPKEEGGELWGFQLWVNLPARQKMRTPRYQDIAPERIPEAQLGKARVRVVAGRFGSSVGPVQGIVTEPQMLDVSLAPGGSFRHTVVTDDNAFVYALSGSTRLGGREVSAGELAVLGRGDVIAARSEAGGRFLLLSARPIREPVARRGPFVMNTEAEIERAISDYRAGRLVSG